MTTELDLNQSSKHWANLRDRGLPLPRCREATIRISPTDGQYYSCRRGGTLMTDGSLVESMPVCLQCSTYYSDLREMMDGDRLDWIQFDQDDIIPLRPYPPHGGVPRRSGAQKERIEDLRDKMARDGAEADRQEIRTFAEELIDDLSIADPTAMEAISAKMESVLASHMGRMIPLSQFMAIAQREIDSGAQDHT